jgi:predicted ribosome quality control (RQC) complex YloA/Tae2 family protein
MSFDALTLSAVRDELEHLLIGARVQRLVFADEVSLTMECFAPGAGRTFVLLSSHPEEARVQRLTDLPARGLEHDTPFSLAARKHLRNARIRSLRQPPLERVLELDCEQRDASGQHYKVLFIVEAMGRRSNLILVDEDGAIIDAARRAPPSRNPRRPILPHLRYSPPPPQNRLLPEQLSIQSLAEDSRGDLATYLGSRVAGLSPQAAREIAFRSTGSTDPLVTGVDWHAVLDAIHEFLLPLRTHDWHPTLALRDDVPTAYAPYRLTHVEALGATLRRCDSIGSAMAAFYAAEQIPRRGDPLAGERRQLLAAVDQQARSAGRRVGALEQQLEHGQSQQEPLRRAGELILTYQPEPGSTELTAEGQSITLDPTLSASENAQAYFARYRKAREAAERVPGLLEEARQHAALLADLRTLVDVASDMNAIRALRREIQGEPGPGKASKSSARSAPYRRVPLGDGWEALIGGSAIGNAYVTFEVAGPDDVWLHARGAPGAHVVLRGEGQPPDDVLERAAQLAAWHSANRGASRVEVDAAARRHVRKIPSGPPGLVRYSNERTVRVTPRSSPS